jgi:hypothetical protein
LVKIRIISFRKRFGLMKNRNSIYFIVSLSLCIGALHFIIRPDYQGIFSNFIHSYFFDILLPFNLYLLLQIALRKKVTVNYSRIIGAVFTLLFGISVEILQLNGIRLFGSTFDPWDIIMYGIGVVLGVVVDLTIINKFEKMHKNDKAT